MVQDIRPKLLSEKQRIQLGLRNFPPIQYSEYFYLNSERNCSFYCWQFKLMDWAQKTFWNLHPGELFTLVSKSFAKLFLFCIVYSFRSIYFSIVINNNECKKAEWLWSLLSDSRFYRSCAFEALFRVQQKAWW